MHVQLNAHAAVVADMQQTKRITPEKQAAKAGLRYVNDDEVGFQRVRCGDSFRYIRSNGVSLRDKKALQRIRKMAIPPAWQYVWICAFANGHIQATGRDQRGRKQYRYHTDFREYCERDKFQHLAHFAKVLPEIRAQVKRDLSRRGLSRQKVLATIVSLLEATLIRIGNENYARQNSSYGITTLKDRHTKIDGDVINFAFIGKSGKKWDVRLKDRRLAKIVKACQDLPGQRLFQYRDDDNKIQHVTSTDINAYLRDLSGADITAKDFRTWYGTLLAAALFAEGKPADSLASAKRVITEVLKQVAARLGNTVAICRKCYVHPAILEHYVSGSFSKLAVTPGGVVHITEATIIRLLGGRPRKLTGYMLRNQIVAEVSVS